MGWGVKPGGLGSDGVLFGGKEVNARELYQIIRATGDGAGGAVKEGVAIVFGGAGVVKRVFECFKFSLKQGALVGVQGGVCLLYTSPSPRD